MPLTYHPQTILKSHGGIFCEGTLAYEFHEKVQKLLITDEPTYVTIKKLQKLFHTVRQAQFVSPTDHLDIIVKITDIIKSKRTYEKLLSAEQTSNVSYPFLRKKINLRHKDGSHSTFSSPLIMEKCPTTEFLSLTAYHRWRKPFNRVVQVDNPFPEFPLISPSYLKFRKQWDTLENYTYNTARFDKIAERNHITCGLEYFYSKSQARRSKVIVFCTPAAYWIDHNNQVHKYIRNTMKKAVEAALKDRSNALDKVF